ncbi:protein serine/threonine phosphatase 2C [Suhomyces tanzawaensis NRRL Y-17324]|uniref:Protein phosphatase n=1 Tax=Suhomyces tanzawaensis NRRL Y-17324 TaxID=984487 RepID=A0A1E4SDY6_9ASCO|nr:protein serine/threonine phosphatase 2C [Suhomyces tanzawaensis NRRL Y-17324]ODV77693.1 protein serine/threonine phosphatase 2C [Suhomyces tanzawaensis NRRL Y-17324]
MKVTRVIALVILSMLLSFVSKRSVQAVRQGSSKRMFSWRGGSAGFGAGSTGRSSSTIASAAATAAALSTNYEDLTVLSQYTIAVAYQPKDREESNLFKKKHNQPLPALESPTGEDNAFVAVHQDGSVAVGVADGVGGWADAGYDSSAISRELCATIKHQFSHDSQAQPKQLLETSFQAILESPKVEIGGTTACLGVISNRKLKVANLGDSWCGVFRNYQLVNETAFQTHKFNTPYQLAKIPAHILRQAELEGRRYIRDTPAQADVYEWDLQKDDVVLFATDGVTDNVVPKDIEIFLRDQLEDKKSDLGDVAKLFVKEVVKVSKDSNFPSAFAQELSTLTGQKYLGGKEDDITVVMVRIN